MLSDKEDKTAKERAAGIYVHVPYCLQKCRYCDFTSFPKAPDDEYFSRLAEDIKKASEYCDHIICSYVDTVFFGGGTPSLASGKQLGTVLDAIDKSFGIAPDAEITIEANPETITSEKAAEIRSLGFNRVSMGVQSLDDDVLSAMGRVHSADRARDAYDTLRDAGFTNINLDLMFGTPRDSVDGSPHYQDLEVWHHTLDEILAMRPEHISFYSLQLENGTPMYEDYAAGRVDLPSWEENREMYHSAVGIIGGKGYRHYEVSNAALPGYECRHNMKYWTMQPYLGFGTSAHSFTGLCRGEAEWSRGPEVSGNNKFSIFGLEPESIEDLKGDYIFTQLRLIDGTDPALYRSLFGSDFTEDFKSPLLELEKEGLVVINGSSVRLTKKGLDFTNPVMERLIEAIG